MIIVGLGAGKGLIPHTVVSLKVILKTKILKNLVLQHSLGMILCILL